VRGRWIVVVVLLAAWPAAAAEAAGRCGTHPWCDTSLSPDRRAALLLDALTPSERVGLLAGDDPQGVTGRAGTHTGAALGVPRLDLPPLYLTDGPVGVRQGQATALPSSLALAASFNRRLARRDGALVGNEAKLKGRPPAAMSRWCQTTAKRRRACVAAWKCCRRCWRAAARPEASHGAAA
jgi:beta-glucosidase